MISAAVPASVAVAFREASSRLQVLRLVAFREYALRGSSNAVGRKAIRVQAEDCDAFIPRDTYTFA
jgi:hypothetical protein